MSGDYSRIAYDSLPNYHAVLLQQGRPLTDRDWNDLVAQTNRRMQATTLDALGQTGLSTATPNAFKITGNSTTGLKIAPGRMYVDGLLAENHGTGTPTWDPVLAELHGPQDISFNDQPYLPGATTPTGTGPFLIYLDVWQREVTQCEDPSLVEKALGVDTTTRLQTVWQVKSLDTAGTSINCATPNAAISDFAPSAARLTITTGDVADDNPCLVPPVAGYKGLENQLYRIEIHAGGPAGTATFKWSRDNASVTTRVLRIKNPATASPILVVESTGKDGVLRFSDGDWIEITDDHQELKSLPGDLRKIKVGGGVDDATRTITLEKALIISFPTIDADGNVDPDRHIRIRRWDQKHQVRDDSDVVQFDLDAPTSTGAIPIPPTGTRLHLEHGIFASFEFDPAGGKFHVGDYWVTAARTSDATVDLLVNATPRGIHHHYAKLAIFTPPSTISPCMVKPDPEAKEACCCTVVVVPGEDIQAAIKSLPDAGGCVCLKPGTHKIKQRITIDKSNIALKGEAAGVRVQLEGDDAVLVVGDVGGSRISGIEVSTIAFERIGPAKLVPSIVAIVEVDDSSVQDCVISTPNFSPSIGLYIADSSSLRVSRCVVKSVTAGIMAICTEGSRDLAITDNRIYPAEENGFFGISVGAFQAIPMFRVVITGNVVERYRFGIYVRDAFEVDVGRNTVSGGDDAIGIGLEEVWFAKVHENVVHDLGAGYPIICAKGVANQVSGNAVWNARVGISMSEQIEPICSQNRISNMTGSGIMAAGVWGARCDIVENHIVGCGFGSFPHQGISAFLIFGDLHIKANEIVNTGVSLTGTQSSGAVHGIAALEAQEATVEGNFVGYSGALRLTGDDDRALLMKGTSGPFAPLFSCLITGNKFVGWGQVLVQLLGVQFSPLVINGFASVFFSNNYCLHFPVQTMGTGTTVVLTGLTANVMGNRVKATAPSTSIFVTTTTKASVIGNITSGTIAAMPAPVPGLNLQI